LVGAKPANLGFRVPGDDDGSFPRFDHRRRQPPGQIQKRHRVDLEVLIQHRGIDLEKRGESAAHGVVDQNLRRPELGARSLDRGVELLLVRHVARVSARLLDLALESVEPLLVPREHCHGVAAPREAARDRGSGSRTNTGHEGHGEGSSHRCSFRRVS
jgi:hypothetical protein